MPWRGWRGQQTLPFTKPHQACLHIARWPSKLTIGGDKMRMLSLLIFYIIAFLSYPSIAAADQFDQELNWLEFGARMDDFESIPEPANSAMLRGSWHMGEGFSLYAESASGSFDLPGEPDHVLNALGIGLSEATSQDIYGTLSGIVYVHKFGTVTDKYARLRYSIHGHTDSGLAWGIGVQGLFAADLREGLGFYLGGEFRFSKKIALSLEANSDKELISYQAGIR